MPLFIPEEKMGDNFAKLLDKYPVTPYLDNKDSFRKWLHFIHNKINEKIGKKQISYAEARRIYMENFKPKPVYVSDKLKIQKQYIYSGIFITSFIFIIFKM